MYLHHGICQWCDFYEIQWWRFVWECHTLLCKQEKNLIGFAQDLIVYSTNVVHVLLIRNFYLNFRNYQWNFWILFLILLFMNAKTGFRTRHQFSREEWWFCELFSEVVRRRHLIYCFELACSTNQPKTWNIVRIYRWALNIVHNVNAWIFMSAPRLFVICCSDWIYWNIS